MLVSVSAKPMRMTTLRSFHAALILAAALPCTDEAAAQQAFQLSGKVREATFANGQWHGEHRFRNVFCLRFPRSNTVETFSEALYNNNALYYGHATYAGQTGLYVIAATAPPAISAEAELAKLIERNDKLVQRFPRNVSFRKIEGALGTSLAVTVRNPRESGKGVPFPLTWEIDSSDGQPLASLSVHRMFMHGQNRIEVAGLRHFKDPVDASDEGRAISDFTELVELAAASLQSCTAELAAAAGKYGAARTTGAAPRPDTKFAETLYVDAVRKKIVRLVANWPRSEDGRSLMGNVPVVISIAADGSLLAVRPQGIQDANHARLGDAMVEIVKMAAPFPPPPTSLLDAQGRYQFGSVFEFSVQKVPRRK